MKQSENQVNSIPPRANAKLVETNGRKFLVGGLTADKVTNDIYEIRIVQSDGLSKIQYKLLKFKNNIFKPRNSFSACGSLKNKIYIWGGLQSKQADQICLHDLIEIDVDKLEMKELPLKQKINVHSSALICDNQNNQLIAIGGTNQSSTMQTYFYNLKLDIHSELQPQTKYQWKKIRLDSPQHGGFLWQHTAHLSQFSYFSGEQGKFLTVIGGCRHPQSPYNSIVQFDLKFMKMSNSVKIKYGLVTHDSVNSKEEIMIVGGATGGNYNSDVLIFSKGKVEYRSGHKAIGCVCCLDDKGLYVIGGVSDLNFNHVVIYKKWKLLHSE